MADYRAHTGPSNHSSTRITFFLRELRRRIWFRAVLYGLAGIATAAVGLFAGRWVPEGVITKIGSDSVGNILSIVASSMLAVATFSLSVMVMAYGNIASGATPRASRLLFEDQDAQRAVATFIGAFLYSIVAIIALATEAYGQAGRFVLFLATVLVVALIVITLIRWVDHLSTLGRVGTTIAKIEKATMRTLGERAKALHLGGIPERDTRKGAEALRAGEIGFVAYVNVPALQKVCERENTRIALELLPGSYAYPGRSLASCEPGLSEEVREELRSHFVIEPSRTFDQDPRYGFVLLSEIASRALSQGVNDPGTAIEVIGAATRMLHAWAGLLEAAPPEKERCDRVQVPALESGELLGDVFAPIARDGAGLVEVGVKLQRSMNSLSGGQPRLYGGACGRLSRLLLDHASRALHSEQERSLLLEHCGPETQRLRTG